jgi:phosphatidylethanolamine-binding protein
VAINLTYTPHMSHVELGNTISVSSTARPPLFDITPLTPAGAEFIPTPTRPVGKTLTLVLTDPDATSRADPVKGQMCHWILGGIRFRELNVTERLQVADPAAYMLDMSEATLKSSQGVEHEALGDLVEYMQPAPPPKTGKHRYIFVLLEAEEGRKDKPLKKPSDRPRWGYENVGQGVMDWAEDNGLVPIGEP